MGRMLGDELTEHFGMSLHQAQTTEQPSRNGRRAKR